VRWLVPLVVTLVACATMLVRAGVHWAATTAA